MSSNNTEELWDMEVTDEELIAAYDAVLAIERATGEKKEDSLTEETDDATFEDLLDIVKDI